jgi:hypothetical protein
MAKMTARATFALDEETMGDIRKLAGSLGVSQAEIVRRSVRLLVEYNEKPVITAADVIEYYRANPPARTDEEYQSMIDDLRRERNSATEARAGKYGWSNE